MRLDWLCCDCGAIVQLQPKRPPGRADRKAAAYTSEILRLRAEGYLASTPIGLAWAEHLSARHDRAHELWDVLMFQAWLQEQTA